jgi:hypothetical protein
MNPDAGRAWVSESRVEWTRKKISFVNINLQVPTHLSMDLTELDFSLIPHRPQRLILHARVGTAMEKELHISRNCFFSCSVILRVFRQRCSHFITFDRSLLVPNCSRNFLRSSFQLEY